MVKKHREVILSLVSDVKLKSTRDILRETSARVNKIINWTDLFRTLKDLADKNLIKMYETNGGFYWIKETIKMENKNPGIKEGRYLNSNSRRN